MKNVTPAVSVIMPAYNCAAYLPAAISSVCGQSFQDWELLVINDASTDNTRQVIHDFMATDPRIRLIDMPHNSGGVNGPRNAGLKAAKGRYIAFLDGDDYWLESKLEEQVAFMQRNDAAISFTAYRRVSPDNDVTGHKITALSRVDLDTYVRNTCIGVLTSMVDREKTGTFQAPESDLGEFRMWVSLLKDHDALFLDRDLARYRRGHGSISSNLARAAFAQAGNYYYLSREIGVGTAIAGFAGYAYNAFKKRLAF
jgi:teichuronic acid biosynthesis glycosyltransferase TuaG